MAIYPVKTDELELLVFNYRDLQQLDPNNRLLRLLVVTTEAVETTDEFEIKYQENPANPMERLLLYEAAVLSANEAIRRQKGGDIDESRAHVEPEERDYRKRLFWDRR